MSFASPSGSKFSNPMEEMSKEKLNVCLTFSARLQGRKIAPVTQVHRRAAIGRFLRASLASREFKIYDATVAKTSLKITSSSFSIYFVIMSVYLTIES